MEKIIHRLTLSIFFFLFMTFLIAFNKLTAEVDTQRPQDKKHTYPLLFELKEIYNEEECEMLTTIDVLCVFAENTVYNDKKFLYYCLAGDILSSYEKRFSVKDKKCRFPRICTSIIETNSILLSTEFTLQILKQICDPPYSDTSAIFKRGQLFYYEGMYDSAIICFSKIDKSSKIDFPDAQLFLGLCNWEKERDTVTALSHFNNALKSQINLHDAHYMKYYFEFKKIETLFEDIISRFDSCRSYQDWNKYYSTINNMNEKINEFNNLKWGLDTVTEYSQLRLNIANIKDSMYEFLRECENKIDTLRDRVLHEEWDNAVKYIDSWRKYLQIFPVFKFYEGIIYAFLGHDSCERSISLINEYVNENPKDKTAYYYLALAADTCGMLDSAMVVYNNAIKQDPYNALLNYNFGILLGKYNYADNADKAVFRLNNAIQKDSLFTEAYYTLAQIYFEKWKKDGIPSDNISVQTYLDTICKVLGDGCYHRKLKLLRDADILPKIDSQSVGEDAETNTTSDRN